MAYTTYENRNEPHITIHRDGCRQIKKRGGIGLGEYHYFDTFKEAHDYASTTGLPVRECSYCKPK